VCGFGFIGWNELDFSYWAYDGCCSSSNSNRVPTATAAAEAAATPDG